MSTLHVKMGQHAQMESMIMFANVWLDIQAQVVRLVIITHIVNSDNFASILFSQIALNAYLQH